MVTVTARENTEVPPGALLAAVAVTNPPTSGLVRKLKGLTPLLRFCSHEETESRQAIPSASAATASMTSRTGSSRNRKTAKVVVSF